MNNAILNVVLPVVYMKENEVITCFVCIKI